MKLCRSVFSIGKICIQTRQVCLAFSTTVSKCSQEPVGLDPELWHKIKKYATLRPYVLSLQDLAQFGKSQTKLTNAKQIYLNS